MKTIPFLLLLTLSSLTAIAQPGGDEQGLETLETLQLPEDREAVRKALATWWTKAQTGLDRRIEWYSDAKFGCFIHWGVYSVPGGIWKNRKTGGYTEHLMRSAQIPLAEYRETLVKPFNPVDFDADRWIQHALDAGMKYLIVTAKHHDGFAMYFSDAWPYDMRMTAFNRDPMAELREAARRRGLKFGFYYSQAFDWEHPDAPGNDWDFPDHPGGDRLLGGRDWWLAMPGYLPNADRYVREKSIPQIQELIRKYDPDILWFDTPHKLPLYQNIRILEAIRQADPQNKIVINGRLARFGTQNFGDYLNTGDRAASFYPQEGRWESIPTTNESYGYSKVDTVRKPAAHFIRLLASATSKGGNILMNAGPMGNGKWDRPDIDLFRRIGDWLRTNGEAIYGNLPTGLPVQNWGVTTRKGDLLYLHVFDWPENGQLLIGGLTSTVAKAWILSGKNKTAIESVRINKKDVMLKLPAQAPDTVNTVIALQTGTRRPADPVRLLEPEKENILLTFDAGLDSKELRYGDGKPNRNYVGNWKSNAQHIRWKIRLNTPATCKMYIQYNTASAEDSGSISLTVDDTPYPVTYTPFTERQGTNTLYAGEIRLTRGEHLITLNGKEYRGNEYMRPVAVRLVPRHKNTDPRPAREEPEHYDRKMAWWREAKFGMFIHWGPYSLYGGVYNGFNQRQGGAEWIMNRCKIPVAAYRAKASAFNPVKFDPDATVRMAKEAGMKYIIFTAKHHDGFAMFKSEASEFNIVDYTPYKKDIVAALAEACRRHGMKLGFYYSQSQDWCNAGGATARKPMREGWPNPDSLRIDSYTEANGGAWDCLQRDASFEDYFYRISLPQIRELLTRYGDVAVIWWDTPMSISAKLAAELKEELDKHPGIITNDRLKRPDFPGDYKTPEGRVPKAEDIEGADWETCMNIGSSWGYKSWEKEWKSPETLIRNLITIAARGGNYLLNTGPDPEGEIPREAVSRLNEMGRWMNIYGEAIYGTQRSLLNPPWGECTRKDGKEHTTLYLCIFDWPADGKLLFPSSFKVKRAVMMHNGASLTVKKTGKGLLINIPPQAPDPVASVIRLELNEKLPPVPIQSNTARYFEITDETH
jgi:alpha-L-fucosidase